MKKTVVCRKCGQPIDVDQTAFGSAATGWEHMEGECPPVYRELTDSEQAAEEATWD